VETLTYPALMPGLPRKRMLAALLAAVAITAVAGAALHAAP